MVPEEVRTLLLLSMVRRLKGIKSLFVQKLEDSFPDICLMAMISLF
jgi:hypothetical protein